MGIRQGIKQGILETAKELLKFGMDKEDIQKGNRKTINSSKKDKKTLDFNLSF